METIKEITTNKFALSLTQTVNGFYRVSYCKAESDKPVISEAVQDLKTALFLFDIKLSELEGH